MIACVWERERDHSGEVGGGVQREGDWSSTSGLSM